MQYWGKSTLLNTTIATYRMKGKETIFPNHKLLQTLVLLNNTLKPNLVQ
jgi:hypothetical protein